MKFRTKVIVKLKEHVKDAKGEAVSAVLKRIGLENEAGVRLGKFFELEISANSYDEANSKLHKIINDVFVNPVVETFEILEFSSVEEVSNRQREAKCPN